MVDPRNRARPGIRGLLGNPSGTANCLSIHVLRHLLNLRGRVPFSKGVSKGVSKRASAELGLRQVRLRQFPYRLVYMVVSDEIVIVAVAHERRRPGYWQDRLPPE